MIFTGTENSRLRRVGGLCIAATLGAALLSAFASATPASADTPDRSVTIDASTTGVSIDPTMYGIFYEDINQGADGGIYAELVQNRSFEFLPFDRNGYTPLTGWETLRRNGADGSVTTANDDQRLNENNRTYAIVNVDVAAADAGGVGIRNVGWNAGQKLEAGKNYTYSVWSRSAAAGGSTLDVALELPDGTQLANATIIVENNTWAKYSVTLSPNADTGVGRLSTVVRDAGTVRLDMVSLFPEDTWNGRENGLRKDLAQTVADLNPGFLRFPGGCIVNTGDFDEYEAPNYNRFRAYQWKETIGLVEERPTNRNTWGYNQTYGLGYSEYFQWAEDLGAEPLPVVPIGVTTCGSDDVTNPAETARYVQDALDLIEFANGDTDTEWGAKRAEYGHPAPYNLKYIGLGNEETKPQFKEMFPQFQDAIQAEYPDITIVGTSGPSPDGEWFDDLSKFAAERNVDIVDEHYYMDPSWFLNNNHRYDPYDRDTYKVFVGEYASRANSVDNALAEASFMTGLERNADVVTMASYAPLLANTANTQWNPDLIYFGGTSVNTTPNYEVQKIFMNNVGTETVPTMFDYPGSSDPMTGGIGLATWLTTAKFDDVKVTGTDGDLLFSDDFSGTAVAWTGNGVGSWSIQDGAYVQTNRGSENALVRAGDPSWTNYTMETKATKLSGDEGFLVAFGMKDTGNFYWWNLGGFGNTRTMVEKAVNNGKVNLLEHPTAAIETGREYDIRIEVTGQHAKLFLDDVLWGEFTDVPVDPVYQVVTKDAATGEIIVKVVNTRHSNTNVAININGAKVSSTAQVTTLAPNGDGSSLDPKPSTISNAGSNFTHSFQALSVTFIRLAAEDVEATPAAVEGPASPRKGESSTFTASGFVEGQTVGFSLESEGADPIVLGSVVANADGIAVFETDFADVDPADYTLVAQADETVAEMQVTILASATDPIDPTTTPTDPPAASADGGSSGNGGAGAGGSATNDPHADGSLAKTGSDTTSGLVAAALAMLLAFSIVTRSNRRRRLIGASATTPRELDD